MTKPPLANNTYHHMNTKSIRILMIAGLFSAGAITTAHSTITLSATDTWVTTAPSNGLVQIGQLAGGGSAVQLQFIETDVGTVNRLRFDLVPDGGMFEWRDDAGASADIKMRLDSANSLILFNSAGSATMSLSGSSGTFIGSHMSVGTVAATSLSASSVSFGSTSAGNLTAGSISGSSINISGTATATSFSGPVTGNASTATALQTARTINGTSFNGTSNITVTAAAGTLTGTALNSGVVSSSLTSVGTVTSGTWSGSFGAVSGANLTSLNADNLASGKVPTARGGAGTITGLMVADQGVVSAATVGKDFGITDARNRNLTAMSLTKTLDPFSVDGMSGVTYNPRTGTLFCIKNAAGAGSSFEFTQDGILLRTITQTDFEDTEAISYVTSFRNAAGTIFDVFLIAEENDEQRLSLCLLSSTATTLDRDATNGTDPDNVSVTTAFSGGTMANSGIEALTFDFTRGLCYYTAEGRTSSANPNDDNDPGTDNAKIFMRSVTANSTTLAFDQTVGETMLTNIVGLFSGGGPLSGANADISDMCYSPQDDTILLLSDVGEKVIKITRAGQEVVPAQVLSTPANQPEGVALNPEGNALWVVGEDGASTSEFFRFNLGFQNNLSVTAALNFPNTTTGVSDSNVTVSGAALGDTVALGVPNACMTATASYFAWVSAANTVTVRFSPKATGGENPPQGDFRVTVIRQ